MPFKKIKHYKSLYVCDITLYYKNYSKLRIVMFTIMNDKFRNLWNDIKSYDLNDYISTKYDKKEKNF